MTEKNENGSSATCMIPAFELECVYEADGGMTLVFELSDDFVAWFKEVEGLKRFSGPRFKKWVIAALEMALRKEALDELSRDSQSQ